MSGGTFQPRIICPGGHYIGGNSDPTTTSRAKPLLKSFSTVLVWELVTWCIWKVDVIQLVVPVYLLWH